MVRTSVMIAMLGLIGGCTIERFHRDVGVTLDYARFSSGTTIHQQTRWQLPQSMRIEVVEIAQAQRDTWLPSAQAGINGVFPMSGVRDAGTVSDLTLLVAWPEDRVAGQPKPGYAKYLRIDKLALSDPLAVQVMLVDKHREVLVQSATMQLNPHWFASGPAGPQHIQEAFSAYATGLIGRH